MMRSRRAWVIALGVLLLPAPGHPADEVRTPPIAGAPMPDLVRSVHTPDPLRAFTVAPNLGTLAGADENKSVLLWNGQTGALQHTLRIRGLAIDRVVFAPDASLVAAQVVGMDGYQVLVVDARTGKPRRQWKCASRPESLTFTADGASLVYVSNRGIDLVNLQTGASRYLDVGSIDSVALSPDGATLAGANVEKVFLWDLATFKLQRTVSLALPASGAQAWLGRIEPVVFSPDGKLLAVSSTLDWKGLIRIFDLQTGELRQRFVAHDAEVVRLLFTRDGSTLISTTAIPDPAFAGLLDIPSALRRVRSEVSFWDPLSGKLQRKLVGKELGPGALLHPDGNTLVTYDPIEGAPIQLWDVRTGTELQRKAPPSLPALKRPAPKRVPRRNAAPSPTSRTRKSKP